MGTIKIYKQQTTGAGISAVKANPAAMSNTGEAQAWSAMAGASNQMGRALSNAAQQIWSAEQQAKADEQSAEFEKAYSDFELELRKETDADTHQQLFDEWMGNARKNFGKGLQGEYERKWGAYLGQREAAFGARVKGITYKRRTDNAKSSYNRAVELAIETRNMTAVRQAVAKMGELGIIAEGEDEALIEKAQTAITASDIAEELEAVPGELLARLRATNWQEEYPGLTRAQRAAAINDARFSQAGVERERAAAKAQASADLAADFATQVGEGKYSFEPIAAAYVAGDLTQDQYEGLLKMRSDHAEKQMTLDFFSGTLKEDNVKMLLEADVIDALTAQKYGKMANTTPPKVTDPQAFMALKMEISDYRRGIKGRQDIEDKLRGPAVLERLTAGDWEKLFDEFDDIQNESPLFKKEMEFAAEVTKAMFEAGKYGPTDNEESLNYMLTVQSKFEQWLKQTPEPSEDELKKWHSAMMIPVWNRNYLLPGPGNYNSFYNDVLKFMFEGITTEGFGKKLKKDSGKLRDQKILPDEVMSHPEKPIRLYNDWSYPF